MICHPKTVEQTRVPFKFLMENKSPFKTGFKIQRKKPALV